MSKSSKMKKVQIIAVVGLVYLFSLSLSASASEGKFRQHWALLVAGSNGYDNYRHQADVCHAYHVVRSHGIPQERIVVMMYDDIAFNKDNPFPGNIINHPYGPNLYPDVKIDYAKEEVKPDVFLKVLAGDEEGVEQLLGRKGRVIKSGPNDNIFVNFVDHGAPGFLAFPSDSLYADDLNNTIVGMYYNNSYNEMVFYVEACESGSMFHNVLRDDINVYATTAANRHESSYACYFDSKRQTYLGDVYSVNWMHDSTIENLAQESLHKQFKMVKAATNGSHVKEFGDVFMRKKKVGDFQGNDTDNTLSFRQEKRYDPNVGAVRSEDVPLAILKHKVMSTANGKMKLHHKRAIEGLLKRREDTKNFFKHIVQSAANIDYDTILEKKYDFSDFKCYKESVQMIKEFCPGLNLLQNDHALRNLRALVNLCEMEIPRENIWSLVKIAIAKNKICQKN